MKAEILDPISSEPAGEVNYRTPIPSSAPPRRRWRVPLALSLGVLVLAASFVIAVLSLHSRADHPSASATAVSLPADEKRWNSIAYVDIEGGVTPLYPLQPGRVESIKVKENEFVKAGTELFRLDDTVPQLKVRQARAGVEAAQGQWQTAQAEAEALDKKIAAQREAIKAAEIEVERAQALYDEKNRLRDESLGSKFEADDAKRLIQKAQQAVRGEQAQLAALEVLKNKTAGAIALAQANLKDKQALLAEAENVVHECIVRAPVDGTPLRILITKGEILGANPHQPAIWFAADRPRLVRAEVEQEFASRVQVGQKVIIQDNITGEEVARGQVASLALWYAPRRNLGIEIAPLSNDNRTLECIIHLEHTSPNLRIWQRVRVQFPD
jgi:multidrug resistance efflux pump